MYDIKLGTGCKVRIKLAENGKILSLLHAKSFILKLTTPKEITQEITGFYDEQQNAIKAKLTPEILNELGVYSISAAVNFCDNTAETKAVKIIEVKADAEDNYDCLTIELLLEVKAKPCGCKSPYVGDNGNWYEWDDETGEYIDTGIKATGSDKNFYYTQDSASDEWHIKHNLNKYPSVTIIDSAGTQIIGAVEYNDINNITIYFASAFSGTATLN